MAAKATFDPVNRIIQLTEMPAPLDGEDTVLVDVQVDLYSDGKEDWVADETLRRLKFPIRAVGGDDTPEGQLGDTYFLASDWKIAPYEANQRLLLSGNLYSEDGSNPLRRTVGMFNVFVERQVSLLVQTQLVQAREIDELHAAIIHRRTRDPVTGAIVIYEADGVTEKFRYDSTDDGEQITEIDPQFTPIS
jgi:hypothetical protein